VAATSCSPLTAASAPRTARAWAITSLPRSSVLLGMHAQYEHSPPTSSLSTSTVLNPPRTAMSATFSPVEPAPSTMTS
jgi:hypothetical protein